MFRINSVAGARFTETLRRVLETASALARAGHAGVRAQDAAAEIGTSRATFYRDLERLRAAGFAVDAHDELGERRHRLVLDYRLPAPGPHLEQQIALQLLRTASRTLDGSFVSKAIDELLAGRKVPRRLKGFHKAGPASDTLDAVSRAIRTKKRLRFYYRGAEDRREQEREVEPIELRLVREQLYLVAWDLERRAPRTFKPLRMTRVVVCPEPAKRRDVDVDALLANSVRVWSGGVVEVTVRVVPEKARFLTEWPLHPQQRVAENADGSAVVTASVAGVTEALRWVLGWGRGVVVLAPKELRGAVVKELEGALAGYGREKVKRVASGTSRGS